MKMAPPLSSAAREMYKSEAINAEEGVFRFARIDKPSKQTG